MSKKYKFTVWDDDLNEHVDFAFTTEDETWGTPVYKFHQFLRGCGFEFDLGSEIGITDKHGEFRIATPDIENWT